jgi:hypothetical protein
MRLSLNYSWIFPLIPSYPIETTSLNNLIIDPEDVNCYGGTDPHLRIPGSGWKWVVIFDLSSGKIPPGTIGDNKDLKPGLPLGHNRGQGPLARNFPGQSSGQQGPLARKNVVLILSQSESHFLVRCELPFCCYFPEPPVSTLYSI